MNWLLEALDYFFAFMSAVVLPFAFLAFVLVGAGALAMWGTNSACERVCQANGDENGWDWWLGCFCKDEHGLYNPKDSRDRSKP